MVKLTPSIGSPKEPSKSSKTKDNVDLAGPSQLLPHANLGMLSMMDILEISLNNNSLIVLHLLEVVVQVVGHTKP
jgi:hypothetical protein